MIIKKVITLVFQKNVGSVNMIILLRSTIVKITKKNIISKIKKSGLKNK